MPFPIGSSFSSPTFRKASRRGVMSGAVVTASAPSSIRRQLPRSLIDLLQNMRLRKPGSRLFDTVHTLMRPACRSEEHTSELQSLMRISYAVFCLKKKKKYITMQTELYIITTYVQ